MNPEKLIQEIRNDWNYFDRTKKSEKLIKSVWNDWNFYKKARTLDPYMTSNHPRFISMLQREEIIDILFAEIMRIYHAQKK